MLVLYGSAARGDSDHLSDVDVLWIADEETSVPEALLPRSAQVSHYDWAEWEEMVRTGSIFLQHLKSESDVLWSAGSGESRYFDTFSALPPYAHVQRDFDAFAESLDSIEAGLRDPDGVVEFELSALAMVVRHLSILVCYLLGKVNFSRLQSLEIATRATGVASGVQADFEYLYGFRMYALGRTEICPSIPERERVNMWIDESRQLVEAGRRLDV